MIAAVTVPAIFAILIVALLLAVPRKSRRPVPGLPEDGEPLECWEQDRWDLIGEHYGTGTARRTP